MTPQHTPQSDNEWKRKISETIAKHDITDLPEAIEEIVAAHTAQALLLRERTDLTNVKHWVEKGLDPSNTNQDVLYRCLQMINDELSRLSKEKNSNETP